VRLSPLGTVATVWPIVPAPDDRWWWRLWSSRWNVNWQGKPTYSEKTCPSATLSTTNPTWPDLGSNPGHGGKPATNCLGHGASFFYVTLTWNDLTSANESCILEHTTAFVSSSSLLQNTCFWAIAFLRKFCQTCLFHREFDHTVFTSLDFAKVMFFTEQGHQPCVQPPTWKTRSPYLCLPVTGLPSYTPRHRFSFCHLLWLAGLWWRYSSPPPHGTQLLYTILKFWNLFENILPCKYVNFN
jgi:hypothetical protein